MDLSDRYLFSRLNEACQTFLKKETNSENALTFLNSALERNVSELKEECLKVIDRETLKAISSPSSVDISSECMKVLLERNTLNIKEFELFQFLINWGKKRGGKKWKEIVKPLLELIRFPLMSFKELIREVRPLGVLSDLEYIEALEFNGDKELFTKSEKSHFQARKPLAKEIPMLNFFLPGPNYSLSNENKTVTKTGENGYCTAITNELKKKEGIHKWSLKFLVQKALLPFLGSNRLGIAPSTINQSHSKNHRTCGWYFHSNGTLWSGPPFNYSVKSYVNAVYTGDVVDVELNLDKKTIKFYVNGKDCGLAYENIPTDQDLLLSVIVCNPNDIVELISYERL